MSDELKIGVEVEPIINQNTFVGDLQHQADKISGKIELPVSLTTDISDIKEFTKTIKDSISGISKSIGQEISNALNNINISQKAIDDIKADIQNNLSNMTIAPTIDTASLEKAVTTAVENGFKNANPVIKAPGGTSNKKSGGDGTSDSQKKQEERDGISNYASAVQNRARNILNIARNPQSKKVTEWQAAYEANAARMEELTAYSNAGEEKAKASVSLKTSINELDALHKNVIETAESFKKFYNDVDQPDKFNGLNTSLQKLETVFKNTSTSFDDKANAIKEVNTQLFNLYNPDVEKLKNVKTKSENFFANGTVGEDYVKEGRGIQTEIDSVLTDISNGSLVAVDKLQALINKWNLFEQTVKTNNAYEADEQISEIYDKAQLAQAKRAQKDAKAEANVSNKDINEEYKSRVESERKALASEEQFADTYETIYTRIANARLKLANTSDVGTAADITAEINRNQAALEKMVSGGFVDQKEAGDIVNRVDESVQVVDKLSTSFHNAKQGAMDVYQALRQIPDEVINSDALDNALGAMFTTPTAENISRVNVLVADLNKQIKAANAEKLTIASDADIEKLRIAATTFSEFMGNVQGDTAQAKGGAYLNNARTILQQVADGAKVTTADIEAAIQSMELFKKAAKADGNYITFADPAEITDLKSRFEDLGSSWSKMFNRPELAEKYRSILSKFKSSMPLDEFKRLEAEIKNFQSSCRAAGVDSKTLGDRLKDAFGNLGSLFSVGTLFHSAINAIKSMVNQVTELDQAVVNLGIAAGKTRAEVKEMLSDYAETGRELGATVTEVAESADTFLRQGLTGEDVDTMIELSTRLSKLGQIDTTSASTALTSAMKGYNVEVSDMETVVDMLTAVDQVSASDAGGLATAMSKTAESAKLAGVEMSTLIGYLATVKEVTQAGDEEVGTFFKTLFARYSNIKSGNLVDPETSESLSDVESTLEGLGISLRSSNDTFREFDEVLSEVQSKWSSFSDVQKRAVAQAFGNTRNQEKFLVLMENYGDAMDYASVAVESAGTSAKKYEIYTSGIEAKQAALTATVQDFSNNVLNSDVYGYLLDMGTALLSVYNEFEKFAGVIPTLVVPVGQLVGIIKEFVKVSKLDSSGAWQIQDFIPDETNVQQYLGYLSQMDKATQKLSLTHANLSSTTKTQIATNLKLFDTGSAILAQDIESVIVKDDMTDVMKGNIKACIQYYSVNKDGLAVSSKNLDALLDAMVASESLSEQQKESVKATLLSNEAMSKSITFAQKAKVAFAALGKELLWSAGISAALALIKIVVDSIQEAIVTTAEAQEALQESSSAYEDSVSDISDINAELETTKERIDEINSADSITLTEREELEQLKETNTELEREQAIKQALAKIDAQNNDKNAASMWEHVNTGSKWVSLGESPEAYLQENGKVSIDSDTNTVENWEEQVGKNTNKGKYYYRDLYGDAAVVSGTEQRIAYLEQRKAEVQKALDEAIAAGNDELVQEYKSQLTELDDKINVDNNILSTIYQNYQDSVATLKAQQEAGYELSDDASKLVQWFTELEDYIIGDKSVTTKIEELFARQAFSGFYEQLAGLAETGELTEETLNGISFRGLKYALDEAGVSVADLIQYFYELQGAVTGVSSTNAEKYIKANSSKYSANDAYDAVKNAMSDYSESGVISEDNVEALTSAIPGLENALWDEAGAWTEAGNQVLRYADNVTLATKKAYEAAIAQKQLEISEAQAKGNETDVQTLTDELNALEQNKAAIDGIVSSTDSWSVAFEKTARDSEKLRDALEAIENGEFNDLTADAKKDIAELVPELEELLEDGFDPDNPEEYAEVIEKINRAMEDAKAEELSEAFENLDDAVDDYGEDSSQTRNALYELGELIPGVSDALYDENGALTAVGQAAIVAANGNKQAAIAILAADLAADGVDLGNLISQMQAAGDKAAEVIPTLAQFATTEAAATIIANGGSVEDVQAKVETVLGLINAANDIVAASGSSSGGGGSSEKDVLEAYKNDQKILEHRIEMSEDLQDLYEEETDEWKAEQSKQYEIYKEYAARIQEEMEKLRAEGYDESSDELMELAEDLSSVTKELYEIEKAIWQANIDSQVEAIEDQIDAENDRWEEREKQLDAEIDRNQTLLDLLEAQYDLTNELRDERLSLAAELESAEAQRASGIDDATLFSTSDYAALMSELDSLDAESVALYNDYVAKIESVSVDEAYKLEEITTQYEVQYDLLSKKYAISKANLALTKAQIALQDAQDQRKMAVLVGGKWTWVADSEAIEDAVQGIYDAETERAQAENDYAQAERAGAMELFIANLEAQKDAEELAHDMLIDSLDDLIDTLKDMKFAMSDFLQALVDAIAAINAAAASAASSSGSSSSSGGSSSKSTYSATTGQANVGTSTKTTDTTAKAKALENLTSAREDLIAAQTAAEYAGGNSTSATANLKKAQAAYDNAKKVYESYATGGVVDYTGLANLHGKPNAAEVVFNATDAKKLYDIVRGNPVAEMLKNVAQQIKANLSSITPNQQTNTGNTIQYIVNGLTLGESSGNLTLHELANKMTLASRFAV